VVYCPREVGSILALAWAETPRLSEFLAVPARFERATCGSEDREDVEGFDHDSYGKGIAQKAGDRV